MAQTVRFPSGLLNQMASQNVWLRGQSSSSGRGVSGREQLLHTENRIWRCTVDLTILSEKLRLEARQLAQRLNGRVNALRLEIDNTGTLRYLGDASAFYAEAGVMQAQIDAGFITYLDGATFGDGTGFALPDVREPITLRPASEGATEIYLDRPLGRSLTPGTRFSINDFLYQVDTNDDGRIEFAPPLREDVAANADVKVSRPTVLLRLTSDDGYEPFERYGRFVDPQTIELEEEFDRVSFLRTA